MDKRTVSLCMIVKNEEKHLKTCLQSVCDVVDEMIIVDTGSTDRTVEIAEEFAARVFHFDWIGDFAAARNYGLEQATGDYILVLDADEYFEEQPDFQEELATGHDAYNVRIKNVLENGAVNHIAIRLIKNNGRLVYRGRIHEHFNIDDYEDLSFGMLSTPLTHVGYLGAIYEEKNKHERNFELLEQAVRENRTGYNLFNLAKQYMANSEYEKAFETYREAFQLSKDRLFITSLLKDMSQCLMLLNRHEDAIRVAVDSFASFPDSTDLYFLAGLAFLEAGYSKDAEFCFKKCLELGEPHSLESLEGVGTHLPLTRLGELYLKERRNLDAFEVVVQALQMKPDSLHALEVYVRTLLYARIPHEEVEKNIVAVHPLTSSKAVIQLLSVLYINRHPLLLHFIEKLDLQVDAEMKQIAYLYGGRLTQAREAWMNADIRKNEHANDLLVLAIHLQDKELLAKAKPLLNVTQKEWKQIEKVVQGEPITGELHAAVGEVLLQTCARLIPMNQFDTFDRLTAYLVQAGSIKQQIGLAELLMTFGFDEGALQLLIPLVNAHPKQATLYQLIGDICKKRGQWEDALSMYGKVIDLRHVTIGSVERLATAYEATNNQQGLQTVKALAKERFPLSLWAQR